MKYPNIPKLKYTDTGNFFLIAGPCVIEDKVIPIEIVERLIDITDRLQIPFMFKASYRKANRSRVDSFTGIGDWEALELLKEIGDKYNVPTVSDIHTETEAETVPELNLSLVVRVNVGFSAANTSTEKTPKTTIKIIIADSSFFITCPPNRRINITKL